MRYWHKERNYPTQTNAPKSTIFYSWQSDIKESRNFISDCLNKLEKKMKDVVLCEIDRDTRGLAGAPDIGDSIYEKIDSADIFIADVTIINHDYEGRKTPNTNVLIELGCHQSIGMGSYCPVI